MACRLDTKGLDNSLGGTEADMFDPVAYRRRLEALEQAHASELEAFTIAAQ